MSKLSFSRSLTVVAVGIVATLGTGRVEAESRRENSVQAQISQKTPDSALDSWRMRMRARQIVAQKSQTRTIQRVSWTDATSQQTLPYNNCPECRMYHSSQPSVNLGVVFRGPTLYENYPGQCCQQHIGHHIANYVKAKLAYFTPSGCCGAGCPPVGFYHRVYAVTPDYFDPRDGQVYAAPGTGIPMAVPLAPNVHFTYNYSNGVPSSRITQISHLVPPQQSN